MTTISTQPSTPERVTGVQLMQGIGHRQAKGFWAEVWEYVLTQRTAVLGLAWVIVITFFAIVAPLIASGYPLVMRVIDTRTAEDAARTFELRFASPKGARAEYVQRSLETELSRQSPRLPVERFFSPKPGQEQVESSQLTAIAAALRGAKELDATGSVASTSSPLLAHLEALDVLILLAAGVGLPWALFGGSKELRPRRFGLFTIMCMEGVVIAVLGNIAQNQLLTPSSYKLVESVRLNPHVGWIVAGVISACVGVLLVLIPMTKKRSTQACAVLMAAVLSGLCVGMTWSRELPVFNYIDREQSGEIHATYTLVPWSPTQRFPELDRKEPMTTLGQGLHLEPRAPGADRRFWLGTDMFGQDVLSNMLHACRLSVSIGIVSTGIALLIGITLGALMGYFGGWTDILLFRLLEMVQSVPLLFLLIIAASVLPPWLRTPYMFMAIIGIFSWTQIAQFTRAEFLRLKNQDFVQSAQAVGLPLRSILFKHMLPNGVGPVLVTASFSIAAAINVEVILSFLGLGPVDEASWGKLLQSAISPEGIFAWWLALFPGAAIFLTVLAYNFIGEAMRDAIDPKLKKARV